MSMSQRTSSATEITKAMNGGKLSEGLMHALTTNFEFEPAKEPSIGLFYLKNQSKTEHGDFVIFDGFYLDSAGNRPTIAVLVHKDNVKGTFAEEAGIPSHITKTGGEIYFLSRAMAEYCVKKMAEPGVEYSQMLRVCHSKTYNDLVDQLEDRDQAGHWEDNLVVIGDAEPSKHGGIVMLGLAEMLVNKKLHLLHVVANLEGVPASQGAVALKQRSELISAMYYTSEAVARMGYNDRKSGPATPLQSLAGRSYDEIQQHLARSAK